MIRLRPGLVFFTPRVALYSRRVSPARNNTPREHAPTPLPHHRTHMEKPARKEQPSLS